MARYIVQQRLNPASLFFSFTAGVMKEEEDEEEENETATEEVDSEASQEEKKQEKGNKGGLQQKKTGKETERPLSERVQEMTQSDKIKCKL